MVEKKEPGLENKDDMTHKPHMRALCPELNWQTGLVFRFGQKKHGIDNFRKMNAAGAGEIFDALMRHLTEYQRHDYSFDIESGLHHLAHASANLHMLYRLVCKDGDNNVKYSITGGDKSEPNEFDDTRENKEIIEYLGRKRYKEVLKNSAEVRLKNDLIHIHEENLKSKKRKIY